MIAWVVENALWAILLLPLIALGAHVFRARPALTHLLWGLILLRLVVPPAYLLWSDASVPRAERVGHFDAEMGLFGVDPRLRDDRLVRHLERQLGAETLSRWLTLAFVLWLPGAGWVVCREWIAARRWVRWIRSDGLAPSAQAMDLVRRVAARLGMSVPSVRVLPVATAPFVCAAGLRPTLVLDSETARHPHAGLIAHELMHLRRGDHWWVRLELFAMTLHWWNPVFWYVRNRMRMASEMACDAGAVQHDPGQRVSFAHALLDAAMRRVGPSASQVLRADHGGASAMAMRIRAILAGNHLAFVRGRAQLAAIFLLASTAALPILSLHRLDDGREGSFLATRFEAESYGDLLRSARESIRRDPENGAHWHRQALALFRLGRPAEAEASIRRQVALGHRPGTGYYNLACMAAHRADADSAFAHLERALSHGWDALDVLRSDPDFNLVRTDPRFARIVARLERSTAG